MAPREKARRGPAVPRGWKRERHKAGGLLKTDQILEKTWQTLWKLKFARVNQNLYPEPRNSKASKLWKKFPQAFT
jgi:hypothetical protein